MQDEQRDTFYIIDTHAEIFRAYYAIRTGLTSSVTGEATHAVFGFAGTLIRILSQLKPKYLVAAIDTPGKTFRNDLYSAYKANRSAPPDDLVTQIHRILQLLDVFGILTLGRPELEADDIIASLTHTILNTSEADNVDVTIVSRDKDLEQLLCDRVTMLDLHKDTIIDVQSLSETKGIKPSQVVDMLALMGDNSDNVPGVEKIGPKTAAQLIQQYDSVDGIFAHIDEIKGKRRENLEKARSQIALAQQLVTLRRDADLDFSLEQARVKPLDLKKILPLFEELELKRYQQVVTELVEDDASDTSVIAQPKTRKERVAALARKTDSILDKGDYDTAATGTYSAIVTHAELKELVETLSAQEIFSFDTETDGLERASMLCGISFSWEPKQGVYVPIRSPQPESHLDADTVLFALKPILEDPDLPKCGHNLKFDAGILIRNGIKLQGAVFDTLLASQLVDARTPSHNLDTLALLHLNHKMISFQELTAAPGDNNSDEMKDLGELFEAESEEQKTIDQIPLEQATIYAAEDADIALRLHHFLTSKLEEMGITALVRDIESPLAPILAEMEYNGIVCDKEELKRQSSIISQLVNARQEAIHEIVGYPCNIDSPRQLAQVLFEELGFKPVKRTRGGKVSTDVTVLETLSLREDINNPKTSVPRLIIEYRQFRKLQSTYLAQLQAAVDPKTERIHTHLYQLTTATGRLKSDRPNLQNIPVRTEIGRQLRRAFIAPEEHKLICADYSQIELRILAHFSKDAHLIETFTEDLDIHTAVASQVFEVPTDAVTRELRDKAKTINFGIIYGVSPTGLSRRIKGMQVEEAAALIADYKSRFPGIDHFLQACIREASDQGYVSTLTGRRRAIPEIYASNQRQQSLGERLAINTVVQGSAADLMKAAMVRVQQRINRDKLPMKMLLQIHDELVLETPEALAAAHAKIVCEEMENAMSLRVPLRTEAGIGDNWMIAK